MSVKMVDHIVDEHEFLWFCFLPWSWNLGQDEVDARVAVAGLSTTCGQKVHNQLVRVEKMHKGSKYVLFLDDDFRLHPGSIGALTAKIEKNPDV
ncbi:hypothetical protein ACB098_08G046500 [Castanea mollissima]